LSAAEVKDVSALGFPTTAIEELNKVTSYVMSFPKTFKARITEASAGYDIFLLWPRSQTIFCPQGCIC
jgi:hypothetical protein